MFNNSFNYHIDVQISVRDVSQGSDLEFTDQE